MSTTRPSRNAARSLALPVTGDFFRLVRADAKNLRRDLDIFVAAAREVDDEVLTSPDLPGHLLGVEDGVGRLESRNRSEEHTSELQSRQYLVCRLLLEKQK